jgi:hypothetical protein
MRLLIGICLIAAALSAGAETVSVKYHGDVPLTSFICNPVKQAGNVTRVCYDAAERYMVIRLKSTYYHYCEIDAATVRDLLAADPIDAFFSARIRGTGKDGPFVIVRRAPSMVATWIRRRRDV